MSAPTFMNKLFGRHARRKPAPARRPKQFRPGIEALDGRIVPANIAANLTLGNLTLTDDGSVAVTVSQPAPNQIRLTPGTGTTINGQALAQTFTGVTGSLNINLGTGTDNVTFDLSQTGIDVGNVSITGTGDKTVVTNTQGSDNFLNVHGNYKEIFGDGNEFTALNQFHVDGNMTIDHANGGSFVYLKVNPTNLGGTFNTVQGDLTVDNVTTSGRAATGFDVNALEETNVGGSVYSNMGNASGVGGWTTVGSLGGGDSVTVGGDVVLTAKTGFLAFGDFANEGLEVQNALVAGGVKMDLGSGVGNTALFGGGTGGGTSASYVSIKGQGAHDAATVGASMITGDLDVALTGRGANSIAVDSVWVGGDTSLKTNGGGNDIRIDDQFPGSTFVGHTDIVMTGRNNFLSINSQHRTPNPDSTTFAGGVTASLGSGRGTLHLGLFGEVDFGAESTFDGGAGHSTAFVGSTGGVTPTVDNFS
jgi:hypothetical protein